MFLSCCVYENDFFQAVSFFQVSFILLNRAHKKWVLQSKKQRLLDAVHTADQAARAYDSFALFQTVNRFTPKSRKRRVQLRTPEGTLASPSQELCMLKEFVCNTWTGPKFIIPDRYVSPGVPFTVQELEHALAKIDTLKGLILSVRRVFHGMFLHPSRLPGCFNFSMNGGSVHNPMFPNVGS